MKMNKLLDRVQKVPFLVLLIFSFPMIQSYSQEGSVDYNTYYQFPISCSIEYQMLNPFGTYGGTFNIFDISVQVRYPIPTIPVLQPTSHLGIMVFDSQDIADPKKWDHNHYYLSAGVLYSNRFSKNFEIGAEALVGYSQAIFPDLVPEKGPQGSSNLLFEIGGRICLNPSYNFSIDINPNIKYLVSLGPLKDFDGLIFGIGFTGQYRFGEDPDYPAAIIRSIRFGEASFPPLFAAMQSFYVKHPVGKISITNTENHPISDVKVSFYQAGYMDSPTPSISIPELGAGESKEVDILASFNEEVFKTEGTTPLTGEIIVTYTSNRKPAEQKQPVSYDLYDKTSLTWDDDRKVAAFITPADSALRNYTSFIRQSCKDEVIPLYCDKPQIAMQVFHALGEIGCIYQVDPTAPFASVKEDTMVVDSVSLPRNTLKRSTGDCDDLTVLYCSLLETVGIETGFITVPGHIYPCFNTKIPGREYKSIYPDRNMTINVDGELWLPVEITMVGKSSFLDACRKGMEEWLAYEESPKLRGFHITRTSQELYRSVGLKETDLGLQYGSQEVIAQSFSDDMSRLITIIVMDYAEKAKKSGKKEDYNLLGIQYAKFMQYPPAERSFLRALDLDENYISPRVNLGNVFFLKKEYNKALSQYLDVLAKLQRDGEERSMQALIALVNASRTYYQMEYYDDAKQYYAMALQIDPEKVKKYSYLSGAGSDETRAAEIKDMTGEIIFAGEEE